ncbi:MAG: tRNA 5-methoxyuridine(34)/uridine 5-oxyacetic acid(34) synthase CmoB [Spirochaetales bacterium]|nr:tRNA 5-methoxyuridine(34)/uridine 5-oxyacetic acid(34) synthase CmoB [Spirochaetales bacterium]
MKWSEVYLSGRWYESYPSQLKGDEIARRREKAAQALDRESSRVWGDPIGKLKDCRGTVDLSGDCPRIGTEEEYPGNREELMDALRSLMPWRKGPLSYFGVDIDAEWRSNLKWDRVAPMLPDLKGKRVCDVGCNNGYYLLRMLREEPELLLGIDPVARYWFNHRLHQLFIGDDRFQMELFGAEDLDLFPRFFDVVFYMGILYHRRSPIDSLSAVAGAMKPGGTLIVECSGIPGEEPYCLIPESRYLKAPGYWFLPTAPALVNMLNRTGFTDMELFHTHKLEFNEQRQTDWARFESLEHFLDESDDSLTVEGYPAPVRLYVRARRKG